MGRPKLRRLTYKGLAQQWGLIWCDGSACSRRWPAFRHRVGAVDQYGYLHWAAIHSRMTKQGLRNFLKLVAWNRHEREFQGKPLWWRLWRMNVLAYEIAESELHIRLRAEDSFRDRSRAHYLARYQPLRTKEPSAYEWMYYPWRVRDQEQRRRESAA